MRREVVVLDLTTDLEIPAFAAVSWRTDGPDERIVLGFGAHLDARVGVLRALTELNQILVMSNDSGERTGRRTTIEAVHWLRTATPGRPALPRAGSRRRRCGSPTVRPHLVDDLLADVRHCQSLIEARGLEVLVLDQTRPDIGLAVVKVIVPGTAPLLGPIRAGAAVRRPGAARVDRSTGRRARPQPGRDVPVTTTAACMPRPAHAVGGRRQRRGRCHRRGRRRRRVNVGAASPGLRDAIALLAGDGATVDQLADCVVAGSSHGDLARLYYVVRMCARRHLLRYGVVGRGGPLAWAAPMVSGAPLSPPAVAPDANYQLSRFALLRREGTTMLLESPRGAIAVEVPPGAGRQLVTDLACPTSAAALAAAHPVDVTVDDATALLGLLLAAAAVVSVAGAVSEDEDAATRMWEPHDLLFHARSRQGRHDGPYGATYRFLDRLAPQPAVRPGVPGPGVALDRPDLAALTRTDPPFTNVVERRRSRRQQGAPITVGQLGEFLFRVARVRTVHPSTVDRPYETSSRPYPSAGAAYDLELYLTVTDCAGIEPGLYHYEPDGHRLRVVTTPNVHTDALVAGARWSAGMDRDPQVLITLASRVQRVSWKYSAIAYATTLKNVGVLYQTMYLAATAMDLAACALGGGDADTFAAASGADYYAEPAVGEFVLGGASRAGRSRG